MNEYRCMNCKSLLYKAEGDIDVEIICPRCRRINYPNRADSGVGLRGIDFFNKARQVNCNGCSRPMLNFIGEGVIETKCRYCKTMVVYGKIKQQKGNSETGKS